MIDTRIAPLTQQTTTPRRRIAIISAILHPSYGGPAHVVRHHVEGMRRFHEVEVAGTALPHQIPDAQTFLPGASIFEVTWPRSWFRSPQFAAHFRSVVHTYDLVHLHMVWDYPVWIAARAATAAGKPYIITPHGTFMEQWRYATTKKRGYRALFLRKILSQAAAVHVLSEKEKQSCLAAGITSPLEIIPNGLAPEAFAAQRISERPQWCSDPVHKYLVYLGRLWHEKGVDLLVEAWARARQSGKLDDWVLVIAGGDFRGYREALEHKITSVSMGASVRLVGELQAGDKAALLQFADAFVQPSRSEALSMALLEAMAAGLPCVYTTGCNLPALAQCGGGIETAVSAAALEDGLVLLVSLSDEERLAMGYCARQLACREYSQDAVIQQLSRLYGEIIQRTAPTRGAKPRIEKDLGR